MQEQTNQPRVKQLQILNNIQEAPVPYIKRDCTDVCCLGTGLLFSLIIFILAIALFDYSQYYHANFPSDSDGRLCGIDNVTIANPYLYFVNPPQMDRRVCVKQCPKPGDTRLACIPTEETGCYFTNKTGFQVINYENYAVQTRSGYFCYPQDQTLRENLLKNANLSDRDEVYNSLDTIILSFLVSLGFCVLYLLFVQFLSRFTNYGTVILGCLMIIACLVCICTYKTDQNGGKIIQSVVLSITLIIILVTSFKSFHSWEMHSIFLRHATIMVKQKPLTLLYIPLFLVLIFGFSVTIILEFTSFWSSGVLEYESQTALFYHPVGGGPIALTVLLAIQTIWGFSFLKLAFSFCISDQTVNWCYAKPYGLFAPFKLLLCKHLGSVIAGSFMTGFIGWMDIIFDTLKPRKNADSEGRYNACYYRFCEQCISIFDLVREDAMSFISLTGNPYCNSSRYCEYLCGRTIITEYSQSISRIYRISAHCLLIGIMIIFSLYVKGTISINALFVVGLVALFTCTLFVSYHADIAQAIQIVLLTQQEFERRANELSGANINNYIPLLKISRSTLVNQVNDELRHLRKSEKKQNDL